MSKETLKLPKGVVHTIQIEEKHPFKSGVNTYEGKEQPWHGYNVKKSGVEYVYFASQSVHDTIQAANVEINTDFTLELRGYQDKEGNFKNGWFLNGKTIWQYKQDEPGKPAEIKPSEITFNNEKPSLTLEEKVDKLWAKVFADNDIPF